MGAWRPTSGGSKCVQRTSQLDGTVDIGTCHSRTEQPGIRSVHGVEKAVVAFVSLLPWH